MGYSETGSESTGWRSYDFLRASAGNFSSKLLIGVPSHMSKWENKSVHEHLKWIAKNHPVGLGNLGCSTERPRVENQRNLADNFKQARNRIEWYLILIKLKKSPENNSNPLILFKINILKG